MNFVNKLRSRVDSDIISSHDLKALLYPMSPAAIHNGVSRALKSTELLQLKRGLYLFSKNLRRSSVSKYVIANRLYAPSYVSFESALSFHGLIPEAVYSITSACSQRKNKKFENELGNFSFDYIPCFDFFLGVSCEDLKDGAFVANPIRALFDLIYLRKKDYKSINEIHADLRIETSRLGEEVRKYSAKELEDLAAQYKKKNVRQMCELLIREFK